MTSKTTKVLIADKLDNVSIEIFKENNITCDNEPDITRDKLLSIIENYDAVVVRSKTAIDKDVIAKAKKLKVIGRAGIGVDTIDIEAASKHGIVVMNTPYGNANTTAEHALSLMFAMARSIPQANSSTKLGKWEKSKFLGTELYQKTLGIIGFGTIGSIVAKRALGLEMKVVAYDPYLSSERAEKVGVMRLDLDQLLAKADVITIHTPLNAQTKNLINIDKLKLCKPNVMIINCARGGIINEKDLAFALENKIINACALDVFEEEPARENKLFDYDNLICTPHLGASTFEAQTNVAKQIAEQISEFLNNEVVSNAVNFPSLNLAELKKIKPFLSLVEKLGSFSGQISESGLLKVSIEYLGDAAKLYHQPLNHVLMAALLKNNHLNVNQVNSLSFAKEIGIEFAQTKSEEVTDFQMSIKLSLHSENRTKSIVGTIFADKNPRIISIDDIEVESKFMENMLFVRHFDKPGIIFSITQILAKNNVNIATMSLGRHSKKGNALVLIGIDTALDKDILDQLSSHQDIISAKFINF